MRIDELSMQLERNPTIVSQLLTQIQDLQNRVNSLSDSETASSSGASLVPSQPLIFPIPEKCEAAMLNCRSIHAMLRVLEETFFLSRLAREGPSSALFENSRNLASYSCSCGLGPGTAAQFGNTNTMFQSVILEELFLTRV